jgi:hypothetical protein
MPCSKNNNYNYYYHHHHYYNLHYIQSDKLEVTNEISCKKHTRLH